MEQLNDIKSLIFDYVVAGAESIFDVDRDGQRQILREFLQTVSKYDSHAIFVDADKDSLLPLLFENWLINPNEGEILLNTIFNNAIKFYSRDIDEIFEDLRFIYIEDRFKKVGS